MTLSNLFSILKAGRGRGNWNHAGIPGHRGGSAPSGINSFQIKAQIKELAKKFGYPENLIKYVGKGHKFDVAGEDFEAAADYNPDTGRIRLFEGAIEDSKLVESIVAHEITHAKFNKFQKEASLQHAEIMKRVAAEPRHGDSFMNPDGSFKSPEDAARYKLDTMRANMTTKWVKTLADDGVSLYSSYYWEQFRSSRTNDNFLLAVDETLAEISARKVGNSNYRPPKLWDTIHTEIMNL